MSTLLNRTLPNLIRHLEEALFFVISKERKRLKNLNDCNMLKWC